MKTKLFKWVKYPQQEETNLIHLANIALDLLVLEAAGHGLGHSHLLGLLRGFGLLLVVLLHFALNVVKVGGDLLGAKAVSLRIWNNKK